ncbi:MAG: carbon storage regulator [Actinomycetota bacterium]|nr:carbon storage regulator [Actinomycetota bacterium]
MLVLNRRPGESIIIQPDLRVTVLSLTDRRVWIGLSAPGAFPELRISAAVVAPERVRLEIVPTSSIVFDGDRVRITAAPQGTAATTVRAGLAVDRNPGEAVEVGDDLWVAVTSISKGNPTLEFGGDAIGDAFRVTLIRPAGSYVRLGVDAPERRVYREELWNVVRAPDASGLVEAHHAPELPEDVTAASAPG